MALPYKINTNDLIEFVKVYNHEYSGKEWSVDSFRTALENWVNPTKIVCESQKAEQSKSNCNLHSVSMSDFIDLLKIVKSISSTAVRTDNEKSMYDINNNKSNQKKLSELLDKYHSC